MDSAARPRTVVAEVVDLGDGSCVVITPVRGAVRVGRTAGDLTALLGACDGQRAVSEIRELQASWKAQPSDVDTMLDYLFDAGCVSVADAVAHTPLAVFVDGTGALAAHLRRVIDQLEPDFVLVPDTKEGVHSAHTDVAIVTTDVAEYGLLGHRSRHFETRGLRTSTFHLDGHFARFGPHVEPKRVPTFGDLVDRLAAAAPDPTAVRAKTLPRTLAMPSLPTQDRMLWATSVFLADLLAWSKGEDALAHLHEVELDLERLLTQRHPVIPVPPRRIEEKALPGRAEDWLVDARTGLCTRIEHTASSQAPGLFTARAFASNLMPKTGTPHDPVGGGSSYEGTQAARAAALGELVERYCGNTVAGAELHEGTYRDLVAAGRPAVDPDSLVLFSDEQHKAPGFPFEPFRPDSPTSWVRGCRIEGDDHLPSLLPAQLVFINWFGTAVGRQCLPTNGTYFTGISAGHNLDHAVVSGLLEVVERHATMVWWLNRQPMQRFALEGCGLTLKPPLRGWGLCLENEFDIPVRAVVVEDEVHRTLTVGFAARLKAIEATRKALAEAVILQQSSVDMLDEDNAYSRTIASGRLPPQGLKPWRADRSYKRAYRSDMRDAVSLICHSQLYLDEEAQAEVRPLLRGFDGDECSEHEGGCADTQLDAAGELRVVVGRVQRAGYEIHYADVTTPDVRPTGLRVVRVLVPGTVANFVAAFPFLGKQAIQAAAVRLGWRPAPLAATDLLHLPIPHA